MSPRLKGSLVDPTDRRIVLTIEKEHEVQADALDVPNRPWFSSKSEEEEGAVSAGSAFAQRFER
jgi:hypothetical protein